MTSMRGRKPKIAPPAAAAKPVKLPRIASITISNNKQNIIRDALASVISRVDICILVDTGITDNTIEVARQVCGSKLRVCRYARRGPIRNFAMVRDAGVAFARESGADWGVIVDTDERVDWHGLDLRAHLTASEQPDVLWMMASDGVYMKEKVVRLSSDAHYYGWTHEVLLASSKAILPTATFEELPRTPEHIKEKYARDLPLLIEMVSRDEFKNDGRWWYYLGDTHMALDNNEQAARAFGRAVELRAPISEDGAWAAYKQAECLCRLNRFAEAVEVCGRGLSRHPGVAELAWLAAFASSKAGWKAEAASWARMAAANGRFTGHATPRGGFTNQEALWENPYDVLRFDAPTPEERAAAEMTFHTAKRARLGAATEIDVDRLGVTRSCRYKRELREMLRPPCIRKLVHGAIELWPIKLNMKMLNEAGIPGWHPLNPSLCLHKGQLLIVVRTVNYHIENGAYVTPDPDGRIRTINLIGHIDMSSSARVQQLHRMSDKDEGPREPTNVLGYEDLRLMSVGGKLWGSATVRDRKDNRCQIALCEIDKNGDIIKAHVQNEGVAETEKNWMPIVGAKEVTWVYGLEPTTIRRARDGHMQALPVKFALDHQRGGSQVIPFDNGYLCVTHEAIYQEGWGCRRIYLHRFIRFDKSMIVTAVSRAFVFEQDEKEQPHYGIEFCSTIARDPNRKDKLILGYGVEDRECKLLVLDEKDVRGMKWWTPEDCK